jgi:hypothetical protein
MALLPLGAWACTEDPTEVSGEVTGDDSPGTTGGTTTNPPATTTTSEATSSASLTGSVDTTEGMVSTTDPTDTLGTTETSAETEQMPETEVVTYEPEQPDAIEDDGYDGMPGSMTCVPLEVTSDGVDVVAAVTLEVGVDHEFVGDLVIKLISPIGTIVTLVSRPGFDEPADNGTGLLGDSSYISADGPVTFMDGADIDAEQMGAAVDPDEVVCINDGICEYDPNPGSAGGGDLSSFVGQDSVGSWRCCVGDAAPDFVGSIASVILRIDQVP